MTGGFFCLARVRLTEDPCMGQNQLRVSFGRRRVRFPVFPIRIDAVCGTFLVGCALLRVRIGQGLPDLVYNLFHVS